MRVHAWRHRHGLALVVALAIAIPGCTTSCELPPGEIIETGSYAPYPAEERTASEPTTRRDEVLVDSAAP